MHHFGSADRELGIKEEKGAHFEKDFQAAFFWAQIPQTEFDNSSRFHVWTVTGTQRVTWLIWKRQLSDLENRQDKLYKRLSPCN